MIKYTGAKRASASTRTPTCVGEPRRPAPDGVSRVQDGVVFRAPDEEQIAKRRGRSAAAGAAQAHGNPG
jgi:hypothetical protein